MQTGLALQTTRALKDFLLGAFFPFLAIFDAYTLEHT